MRCLYGFVLFAHVLGCLFALEGVRLGVATSFLAPLLFALEWTWFWCLYYILEV